MTLRFEPILPKPKKPDEIYKEFYNLMRRTGRKMEKEWEKVFATWENKPKMVTMTSMSPYPAVTVVTNDPIVNMLDKGIPEHIIEPKNKNNPKASLVFPWDGPKSYGPKTAPKWIGSKPAIHPTTIVNRPWVIHPGVEARKWDETISKAFQPQFTKDCKQAVRDALEKAGITRL